VSHVGPLSDHPLDDLAAYAVDALEPAERLAVDDHLAHCSDCSAELAGHREALGALATVEAPPPEVWRGGDRRSRPARPPHGPPRDGRT
jgi:anti-sigma factor RsiW